MTARSIKKADDAEARVEGHVFDKFDTKTTIRVVESLVVRGDISALTPEERLRHYVQMCESLGLNPAAQPFAILRLNGKEILYPTRGATDQLAAIHKLNREIIDGPKVIDLGGQKLVYAVCKATHPNGRVETAVATVPLTDPVNVLMKAETKAKRRATLSILGLGMLDETELDTIPSHMKQGAAQVEVPGADPAALPGGADPQLAAPAADDVPPPPAPEVPAALASFEADLGQIELPAEAVSVWMKHRTQIATLTPAEKEAAWKALCKRTEDVGKMKNAKVWLKRAIAEEEARRTAPDNNQFG